MTHACTTTALVHEHTERPLCNAIDCAIGNIAGSPSKILFPQAAAFQRCCEPYLASHPPLQSRCCRSSQWQEGLTLSWQEELPRAPAHPYTVSCWVWQTRSWTALCTPHVVDQGGVCATSSMCFALYWFSKPNICMLRIPDPSVSPMSGHPCLCTHKCRSTLVCAP